MKVPVGELQKDKDPAFNPCFNLQAVLVEEAGALRGTDFAFLAPSGLD